MVAEVNDYSWILWTILCCFLFLSWLYKWLCRKFESPYKLHFLCGKPGSGKTTVLAKIVQKRLKQGWHVYSTVPIAGAILFDETKFGQFRFPRHSWIIWDEAGLMLDNRNYAKLPKCVRNLIKYHRHYGLSITFASQGWDIDLKIRQCCSDFYLLRSFAGVFSIVRHLVVKQRVAPATASDASSVVEDLAYISPLAGGLVPVFMPKYWGLYDSWCTPLVFENEDEIVKAAVADEFVAYPDGKKFDRFRRHAPGSVPSCSADGSEPGQSFRDELEALSEDVPYDMIR